MSVKKVEGVSACVTLHLTCLNSTEQMKLLKDPPPGLGLILVKTLAPDLFSTLFVLAEQQFPSRTL